MNIFGAEFNSINLKLRADRGDLDAMNEIVVFLAPSLSSVGNKEPVAKLYMKYLKVLTEAGETRALIMMGDEYRTGRFVKQDMEKALQMYDRAIAGGELFGYECKGLMYFEKWNRKEAHQPDYAKALSFFEQAIAAHYFTNCEVVVDSLLDTQDPERIQKRNGSYLHEFTYREAVDQLTFASIYALGEIYRRGLCGETDMKKAAFFYERITYSDLEYKEFDDYYRCACYRTGLMILRGYGQNNDINEAMRLFETAEESTIGDEYISPQTELYLREIAEELKGMGGSVNFV